MPQEGNSEQKRSMIVEMGPNGYPHMIEHTHYRINSILGFKIDAVKIGSTLVFTTRPDVAERVSELLKAIDEGRYGS